MSELAALRADVREIRQDVKRLLAFRGYVLGVAAAVSAGVSIIAGWIGR